jgi:hypothetical protein
VQRAPRQQRARVALDGQQRGLRRDRIAVALVRRDRNRGSSLRIVASTSGNRKRPA